MGAFDHNRSVKRRVFKQSLDTYFAAKDGRGSTLPDALSKRSRFDVWPRISIFSANPLEYFGGGEAFAMSLANTLLSLGYQVRVVADSRAKKDVRISLDDIGRMLKCEYTKLHYVMERISAIFYYIYQPLPPIAALRDSEVNLVFVYRPVPKSYLKSISAIDSITVFLFHGITIEKNVRHSAKVLFFENLVKFRLRSGRHHYSSDNVFSQVLNQNTLDFLLAIGIDREHIFKIPFAQELGSYRVTKVNDVFQVVFIGRLNKNQKGIDTLSRAISEVVGRGFPEIRFVVIGTGPDLSVVEEVSDGSNSVKITGYVSSGEKVDILSKSNLMLITSNIDPYPATVQEGLASGLPVVSTNVSGPSEMIEKDPIFGSVVPHDIDSIVSRILVYFENWRSDKDRYYNEKLVRRQIALSTFDPTAMMVAYKEMIERVLHIPGPP